MKEVQFSISHRLPIPTYILSLHQVHHLKLTTPTFTSGIPSLKMKKNSHNLFLQTGYLRMRVVYATVVHFDP